MRIKHYLIPSEHNDYRPWIITPTALAIFCLVIWSLRLIIPATITFAAPSIDPYDLMNKINNERTQRFIPALFTNEKLITAATGKAHDMLDRDYFAHVDPDGNYVWSKIEAAGYKPYLTLGENLAMDFNSANEVVNAWMNSPTHRANIVNEKFEDQGLSSIYGQFEPEHNTIMVVSLFGTLYKSKPVPQPAPIPAPDSSQTPKPNPLPAPNPTPTTPKSALTISKDIKISTTSISGHILVNLDVVINGAPALSTAQLKSQSISLIAGKISGQFLGSFTFDAGEDLTKQTLIVETRDKTGNKISQNFPINIETSTPSEPAPTAAIPVSNEASIILILRIMFGVFAAIYMVFLGLDAIIIHRAKVKRIGIHSNPHLLVFFLIVAVSLFGNWL